MATGVVPTIGWGYRRDMDELTEMGRSVLWWAKHRHLTDANRVSGTKGTPEFRGGSGPDVSRAIDELLEAGLLDQMYHSQGSHFAVTSSGEALLASPEFERAPDDGPSFT